MLVPEPVFAGGPVQVIPEGLPASTAALSEPLACCLNAWESIPRYDGGRLVVLGAGAMGRLLARLGRACFGIEEVTFVEPIPARRQAVLAEADRVVDAADADAVLALRGVEGEGPDVVMVACADRRAQEWALSIVGRGGAVNLFAGLAAPDTAIPLRSDDVHYRELIVTASHGSTPRQHRDALALLASGTVPADGVLADPVPLLDLPDAVQRAADGVPGKAWFQPSVERVP
jgi:L-iditol 2-dehydrogenase